MVVIGRSLKKKCLFFILFVYGLEIDLAVLYDFKHVVVILSYGSVVVLLQTQWFQRFNYLTLQSFDFECLMKVIPEKCRSNLIRYFNYYHCVDTSALQSVFRHGHVLLF